MRSTRSSLFLGTVLALASSAARAATLTPDPWPREFASPKGNTIVVYQPQMETFKGDTLTGRAAVSVSKKGDKNQKFGVFFFSASVSVDRNDRSVEILRAKVDRVRFPGITPEKERAFAEILEAEVPRWNLVLSYDRVLESVKVAEREKRSAQGLKNDPPRILFAEEPTVLVTLDGAPQLRDVEGAPLRVVVNTALFMVLDTRNGRFYLSGGRKWWYEAGDALGPWRPIGGPPGDIADLAERAAEAQKKDDAEAPDEDGTETARPPRIVVATEPTELIVSEGKPSFKPVAGASADLLSMENTESDVLLDVPSQQYYVLLSGRWFRGKTLTGGTWSYVSPDALPKTFAKVAPESSVGEIRASVPGTDEAEDALLDAQIPQTTAVRRADATLDVRYDGEPRFKPVDGTRTAYATNTPTSVLRISGRYYACEDAVWYVADSPTGPWVLADSIPSDDIDQIPPSAPVYNVKYVRIYDETPDEVTFGYTPGYVGAYPWYGTVVWGTGWDYEPWIGSTYWWPRPYTWGFHARYTPWAGWGFGCSWSYPFFNVAFGWGDWFRPFGWGRPYYHGGWRSWHHSGWFGPGGYRPPHGISDHYWGRPRGGRPSDWNRASTGGRTVTHGRPVTGDRANIGFRPPSREIRPPRPENNLYHRSAERPRDATRAPSRESWRPTTTRPNNVYGDRDGEVYRRTNEGWQRRDSDRWRTAPGPGTTDRANPRSERSERSERPALRPERGATTRQEPRPERGSVRQPAPPRYAPAPRPELDRDFSARQRGEARARESSRPAPQARPAPPARSAPQAAPRSAPRSAPERPAPQSHGERRR